MNGKEARNGQEVVFFLGTLLTYSVLSCWVVFDEFTKGEEARASAEIQIPSLFLPSIIQSPQQNFHHIYFCIYFLSPQMVSSVGVETLYLLFLTLCSAPRVMPGEVIQGKYLLNA